MQTENGAHCVIAALTRLKLTSLAGHWVMVVLRVCRDRQHTAEELAESTIPT